MSAAVAEKRLTAPLAASARDIAPKPLGNRDGVNVWEMPQIPPDSEHRLSMTFVEWNSEFLGPPHRHNFDQIRYVISGRLKVSNYEMGAGDILYYPEGAWYGPQKVIGEEKAVHVNIQFPGPTRDFYPLFSEQLAAARVLARSGEFKKGMYVKDGETFESFEKVYEQIRGSKPDYPDPRIKGPVVFDTNPAMWRPVDGMQGLSVKHVAYLNEVGPNIKLIKLDAGAQLPAVSSTWEEMRFVVEGEVEYAGETYPSPSGFFCPDYLTYAPMKATTGALLVVVQIARDWRKAPTFFAI